MIAQRNDSGANQLVGFGILLGEPFRDHAHFALGALHCDAWFKPGDGLVGPPRTVIIHPEDGSHRHPDVALRWEPKIRRHHAHDRPQCSIEADLAADDVWVSSETFFPKPFAD